MTDPPGEATAFAPGHVTALFAPYPADDPVRAGSRGAGLALSDGVEATVGPVHGDRRVVRLDGEVVDLAAVTGVLDRLAPDARVAVDATTDLPVGAGFGVSGAAALAVAFAANDALELGRSENELVRAAHAADAAAGTGLGDVVAQFRGGVPLRLEPGAPGHGALDGVPARPRVEYVTFGELSTAAVLDGDLDPVRTAGEDALTRVVRDPTLDRLVTESRRFADEAGLLVPEVREAVEAVDEAGGRASMAMLGRTAFAVGTGLSDAGYDPAACRVHPAGATLR
ncbi:pantoate kinase [Candidatus Halobonum tyrrellensis]|uniref:Pantoate kinase n=1 Tax=Candidatus Halobonum tyrrellensis G22 TaxID=1324957 RepID=V4IXW5_9EURY|nr:pantoate kinase [Candidatus Halobonum tyrrellensis]ESP88002.1 putative kinase, sugar kinase superfamily protein [Candidatus Halobonum tyrrellensis G22]